MSFFDTIILDVILILFPVLSVLLLKAYYKSIKNITNDSLIDIANITSLFFLIKYYNANITADLLLINMPLIISIIYNRKKASVAISLIIIVFNVSLGNNLVIVILEYLFYILVFVILTKKVSSSLNVVLSFVFVKGIAMTIEEYYILNNSSVQTLSKVFVSLIVFYLIGKLVINIISKIEQTISLNQTLKELEKEKNLRNSLFKITHEVKNPIAVCKGYLSMIDYNDVGKASKYNEIVLNEIDRALDIMDNFSEYTKISIDKDIMDLDSLITDTIDSLMPIFKSKNILINYDFDDEVYIEGDYKRLKQVLINMLKNSVEAIVDNGLVIIDLKRRGSSVNIEIKDNGCGISKEDLSKIGNLFYSSKQKGCGIGVALSKEIISLHDGDISYKSELNKYTQVSIKLPLLKTLH